MTLTAYVPSTEELESDDHQELEAGQMVRVGEEAWQEADVDVSDMDEEDDGEHDYERIGFILEIHEDEFSWVGEDDDESVTIEPDGTMYVVGMAPLGAGAHPFPAEVLEPVDRDTVLGDMDIDPDPEEAEDEMEELADVSDVPGVTRTKMGLSPWPRSWRNSNKPARLIAMDAWISMGRSFRGCRRSVIGNVRNPNRLCASFKDAIYMHPYWREGGG